MLNAKRTNFDTAGNRNLDNLLLRLVMGFIVLEIVALFYVVGTLPDEGVKTTYLPQNISVKSGEELLAVTGKASPPQSPAKAQSSNATSKAATPVATVAPTTAPALPAQPPKQFMLTEQGIIPARIRIPFIGVDSAIENVGLDSSGIMAAPKDYWKVGWFEPGARPGQLGSAVMAGHLDSTTGQAIFWELHKLQPGNRVYVADKAGHELVFEVTGSAVYPYNNAPLAKIFGDNSARQLNLITCNGLFDRLAHNYDKRLVVFSRLISTG